MTAIGEIAKGFLITFVFFYVLAMIGNLISGNTALFLFMLIGLIIPSLWIVYGYSKSKREDQPDQS